MFPLAFVAGWLQGHWWGFISRNYVVWPTFLLMNVFIALKGSHFLFFILQQGYRYHKLRKTFSKFYRRHYELVSKFNVGLKTLLHQGLSEPEFYGDLVYKFKKIVGRVDFSDQFRKIIVHYKRIGYNINIMRRSARAWCLAQSRLITLLPSLIARRLVGRQTQWCSRHKAIYFSWFGPELFCLLLGPPGFDCWFSSAPVFQWCCSTPQGSPGVGRNTFLSSPHLCFVVVFVCDLFVSRGGPLVGWRASTRTEQLYVLSHDRSWGRG